MKGVERRASGVLLHPTSLPGGLMGDLSGGYAFIDWLKEAGQQFWQILPLVPVTGGGSPYSGLSAFAGNPMLISPGFLVEQGLLTELEVKGPGGESSPSSQQHLGTDGGHIDFSRAFAWKDALLVRAHERFTEGAAPLLDAAYTKYCETEGAWLYDYALFRALRAHYGNRAWTDWDADIRDRHPEALEHWRRLLARDIDRFAFEQMLFDREWQGLRHYAAERNVSILGDLPIFVAHDSADVWAHPDIFRLDEKGVPEVVAGVPPDYFSETGQRWGNPLYRWDLLRSRGYDWWVERFRRTFAQVDVVRVDHFRGFESYWEIPAEEETAVRGVWREGPGEDFFREVERQLPSFRIVVEDLGIITPAVNALRERIGAPGMRVLQFAFDGDPTNPHLPENYTEYAVAYTGTHDNDTLKGWWEALSPEDRRRVRDWVGTDTPTNWNFVESVMRSPARLVIIPLQDLEELGTRSRMNVPGVAQDNWTWQATHLPGGEAARRLYALTSETGRL
jgi:4-alpha-glucanotransferase